jgi:hypothetical protein
MPLAVKIDKLDDLVSKLARDQGPEVERLAAEMCDLLAKTRRLAKQMEAQLQAKK